MNISKVAVIGLGYVGLPLVSAFLEQDINVVGIDIDKGKLSLLKKGISPITHNKNDLYKSKLQKKFLTFTNEFEKVSDVDAVIICVPTPVDAYDKPNLDYVFNSARSIRPYLNNKTLVVLESTTYPGTCVDIKTLIFDKEKKHGVDYILGYSPERENPGIDDFNLSNTPKIVSGYNKTASKMVSNLYSIICNDVVEVSSLESAETIKLLENIQRSVNIGLMNEMKIFCNKFGLNIFEIIDGASTKPFGFNPYYPGPGVGGHCIPIDPFYLSYKAKDLGLETDFINIASRINRSMPDYVIDTITRQLNKLKISLSKSKILCLGISYKKNVGDTRESPQVIILDKLIRAGSKVSFSDPFHLDFPKMRGYDYSLKSLKISPSNISKHDMVLLLTDHDEFDYDLIGKHAKMIIDTRGVFARSKDKKILKKTIIS